MTTAIERGHPWFAALGRLSAAAFLLLDERYRIVGLSDAARSWLGTDLAPNTPLEDLVEPADDADLRAFLTSLTRTGPAEMLQVVLLNDALPEPVTLAGQALISDGVPLLLVKIEALLERAPSVDETELTRRALRAQEMERKRLAQELHDDLGQMLTAVRLELDLIRLESPHAEPATTGDFQRAYDLLDATHESVRRLCRGLRPPMLERLGLLPALHQLVEDLRAHTTVAISVDFVLPRDEPPVPEGIALVVFRTLQETMNNALKHAHARGLWLSLYREGTDLVLSVYDDGVGLEPDALERGGFGLLGMRERAELAGGTLAIASAANGGTRVTLSVPVW